MDKWSRRRFIGDIACLTLAALVYPWPSSAAPRCDVMHPLSPPDPVFHGRCPNCGMTRAMWARTWKTFDLAQGHSEACSFHCLVEQAEKSAQAPAAVQTALFLQPRGMVPAGDAWYVVGSSARGTMTKVSKAAFASRAAADEFARICGGRIMDFTAVYRFARETLVKEIAMIDRKRLSGGKSSRLLIPETNASCAGCIHRGTPATAARSSTVRVTCAISAPRIACLPGWAALNRGAPRPV